MDLFTHYVEIISRSLLKRLSRPHQNPYPIGFSGISFFGNIFKYDNIIHHFKLFSMGNLLYLIAVILVIAWAIGFLGYGASGLIHILLVIAVVVVLLRIIRGAAN